MPSNTAYQFRITLNGSGPAIWRRILVRNCTLDKLHENIQMAMGWHNSHVHQFEINGDFYSNPEFVDDLNEIEYLDSTVTRLSDIIPNHAPFHFLYEYDLGDSWVHEITFEGLEPIDARRHYPVCLGGARACPPENVGGIWGYEDFLEKLAMAKKKIRLRSKASFDPEAFDAARATRRMQRGLPDQHNVQ